MDVIKLVRPVLRTKVWWHSGILDDHRDRISAPLERDGLYPTDLGSSVGTIGDGRSFAGRGVGVRIFAFAQGVTS